MTWYQRGFFNKKWNLFESGILICTVYFSRYHSSGWCIDATFYGRQRINAKGEVDTSRTFIDAQHAKDYVEAALTASEGK